jgi:hypothetical protein
MFPHCCGADVVCIRVYVRGLVVVVNGSLSSECQMKQNKWSGVTVLWACRYATRIPNSSSETFGVIYGPGA